MKIDVIGVSKTWETQSIIDEIRRRGIICQYVDPRNISYIIDNDKIKCFYEDKNYELPKAVILRGGLTRSIKDAGRLFINFLELSQVKVLDKPVTVWRDLDKAYQSMCLVKHGLPHPKTFYKIPSKLVNKEVKTEIVTKPVLGSKGRDISKRQHLESELGDDYLAQEFRGRLGEDIRVLVVNGKIIGAMKRKSQEDEWRSNVALGGKGEIFEITENLEKVASEAQKSLGMFFSGIDLLEENGDYIVLEVNRAPQFREFQKITNIDVAQKVVEELINEVGDK